MTSSARLQEEANVARAGLSSALDDLRSSVTTTALTNGAMTFAKEGSTAVARAAIDSAAVGAATSAASATGDRIKDAASSAGAMAGDIATDAYGKATGAYDKATGLAAEGQQQGQQALEQAQQLIAESRTKLEQFAHDQPILVAALGVAFGAALGAALPMTKAETDFLGDKAKKAASHGVDIAKHVADAVTDKLASPDLSGKVGEVVTAVRKTVSSELAKSS